MKYRGNVISIDDPKQLGRIRVRIAGFQSGANIASWAWPCTLLAGPGYGLYMMPSVNDEVYVELDATNRWVYTGFYWTERNAKPSGGSADRRILQTPAGHQISLDDSGSISINHANGSSLEIDSSGNIEISCSGAIALNGKSGNVVTTECICSYTGTFHPQGSTKVKAG